ncbi:hypothetical protein PTM75_14895, partial [Clostridium perfringens]|nr:hypothetical protein [Clostridium perfringens]
LGLFLKAHFLDLRLERVEFVTEYGRVIRLHFSGGATLEIRLFPGGQNILANANERSIAWAKPQELKALTALELKEDSVSVRSWQDISQAWMEERQG